MIGPEHTHEDLLTPRTDSEGFRVGPWDVPEKGDLRVGPFFLDEQRQESEVIVLNKNQRRLFGFNFCQEGPRQKV